jgi:hypothetical protein
MKRTHCRAPSIATAGSTLPALSVQEVRHLFSVARRAWAAFIVTDHANRRQVREKEASPCDND